MILHHSTSQSTVQFDESNNNKGINQIDQTNGDSQILAIINAAINLATVLSIIGYLQTLECKERTSNESSSNNSPLTYLLIIGVLLKLQNGQIGLILQKIRSFLNHTKKSTVHPSLSRSALQSLSTVSSSDALSKLSRVASTEQLRKISRSIHSSIFPFCRGALHAITRKECFVRLDYIEKLSITDLIVLFRYATHINQSDFDKKTFLSQQGKTVKAVITAIDTATKISRGSCCEITTTDAERKNGDVDALYFTAVVRIFTEWRIMRLDLNGYKRYSVGLSIGYRDLIQNLAKIEMGVHSYLECVSRNRSDTISSPTLRQLLEHELDMKLHKKLPALQEKSAASGLLWAKRQVHYQTSLFFNSLNVPDQYPTTKDAAMAAYTEVYGPYHGWAARQVFHHSFGGTPPLEKIWKKMTPPFSLLDDDDDSSKKQFDSPPERKLSEISEDDEFIDNDFIVFWEEVGKNVAGKWEDFLNLFNCVPKNERTSKDRNLILSSKSYLNLRLTENSTLQVFQEDRSKEAMNEECFDPVKTAKNGASEFVSDMNPLLTELNQLVDDLNMNDPSRV